MDTKSLFKLKFILFNCIAAFLFSCIAALIILMPIHVLAAPTETTLLNGKQFNIKLKTMIAGTATDYTSHADIHDVVWDVESFISDVTVQTSGEPVYARYDNESKIVHLYTEADTIYFNTDCSYMFAYYTGYTRFSIFDDPRVDTTTINNASYMFAYPFQRGDSTLHSYSIAECLDLTNFNTSSISNMSYMFAGGSSTYFRQIDITGWDTSNVTTMANMFYDTFELESIIGIENLDVSNCTNFRFMFATPIWGLGSSLCNLDLHQWDVRQGTDFSHMFHGCESLQFLDISGWEFTHDIADIKFAAFLAYSTDMTSYTEEIRFFAMPWGDDSPDIMLFGDMRLDDDHNYIPESADIYRSALKDNVMHTYIRCVTIHYNYDNAELNESKCIYLNNKIDEPSITPTREHATFNSWEVVNNSNHYTEIYDANKLARNYFNSEPNNPWNWYGEPDYTIQPVWIDETHDVSFITHRDAISAPATQSVVYGQKASSPTNPQSPQEVFMGWYLENATEPFDFNTPITEDIVLHAKWGENYVNIRWLFANEATGELYNEEFFDNAILPTTQFATAIKTSNKPNARYFISDNTLPAINGYDLIGARTLDYLVCNPSPTSNAPSTNFKIYYYDGIKWDSFLASDTTDTERYVASGTAVYVVNLDYDPANNGMLIYDQYAPEITIQSNYIILPYDWFEYDERREGTRTTFWLDNIIRGVSSSQMETWWREDRIIYWGDGMFSEDILPDYSDDNLINDPLEYCHQQAVNGPEVGQNLCLIYTPHIEPSPVEATYYIWNSDTNEKYTLNASGTVISTQTGEPGSSLFYNTLTNADLSALTPTYMGGTQLSGSELPGYEFLGWMPVESENTPFDATNAVAQFMQATTYNTDPPIKLMAAYTPVTYTIQVHNEQYPIDDINVVHGHAIVLPALQDVNGLVFDGYYTDADYIHLFNPEIPITQPFTLYLKWREHDFTTMLIIDETQGPAINLSNTLDTQAILQMLGLQKDTSQGDTAIHVVLKSTGITKTANGYYREDAATIDDEYKTACFILEAKTQNAKATCLFDLSSYYNQYVNATLQSITPVSSYNNDLEITMSLSEILSAAGQNTKTAYSNIKDLKLASVHNGEYYEIPLTYDAKTSTISFKISKFSAYMFSMNITQPSNATPNTSQNNNDNTKVSTIAVSNNTGNTNAQTNITSAGTASTTGYITTRPSVQTDDEAPLIILLIIIISSILGAGLTIYAYKHKRV